MQIMGSILIICLSLFNGVCWEVSKKFPDLYNRDCMVVPENNYSTMVLQLNASVCPKTFFCWKSHLRIISKANLTWILNTFRNELAEKMDIGGMMKVNWHWMLEIDAMNIIVDCPQNNTAVIETRDIGGLDYRMSCEESIIKLPVYFDTQDNFINYYASLLRQQQKEKGEYYKLPSMSHFGCSTVFYKQTVIFVCIYCSKQSQLSSTRYCPDLYEKNKTSEFPYLCAHKFQKSIYGCESSYLKSYCDKREPPYLQKEYDGFLRYMYAVTDGDNFLIFVNNGSKLEKGVVLGCEEQGGQCAPTLPAWNYVYSAPQILQLNKSVFFNDNKTFIRYGSYNVDIQIDQTRKTTLLKASCCSFIFFFLFLTILAIIGVMYFTYVHYKSHQA